MGLIQAALSAAGTTLSNQWKEYFYCDAISSDTIVVRGHKKVSGFSSNHGDDNIISDGSVIAVADGQCMIITEQGKIVEICAEPGEYKYDASSEPSIFTGSFGQGLKDMFAQFGKAFTFGGQKANDQRVYYINTKEIMGVKYGTANPVPFRVVDTNAHIDMDISVKCFGEYSIRVSDPVLFYTNVCGNVSETYKVSDITDQLRTELLTALQPAFGMLSEQGIRYSSVVSHTTELADALNKTLSSKWSNQRGIEIVNFGISSIKADEEDEKRLKDIQATAVLQNQAMRDATLVQAVKDAANNPNGAAMGMFGMNTVAGTAASMMTGTAAPAAQPTAPAGTWTCPTCGAQCTGNFCSTCGAKKPEADKWVCPTCGVECTGNFCPVCGAKKPA